MIVLLLPLIHLTSPNGEVDNDKCNYLPCPLQGGLAHSKTDRYNRSSPSTMSSYDPPADVTGIITEGEMRRSMQLVRLQIATPLSLLMTIGANLVCALAIKPGLGESL